MKIQNKCRYVSLIHLNTQNKRCSTATSLQKGFTLVELIVVITILAILSTIGFVSYSGYLAGTRDTSRIASLKAISDGLELYRTKHNLPMPEDYVEVRSSGSLIAYQGYVGKNVLETIEYSTEGIDPKDGTYYSYYLTRDKKYYQLMAYLEEADNLQANSLQLGQTHRSASIKNNVGVNLCVLPAICNTAQAIDYSTRYPTVYGKKLGILTDTTNTPIQEISSSGYIELAGDTNEYVMHIKDNNEIKQTGENLRYNLIARAESKYFAPKDCPDGFVGVPGNARFNQKGFCVAQYEMSYEDITIPDSCNTQYPDSCTDNEDWNTVRYRPGKKIVSMPGKYPIVNIKQDQAIEACISIGAHLITNNEWMTIARNVELEKENYIAGGPGDGVLKNGVSNDTSKGCNKNGGNTEDRTWATVTGSPCDGGRNRLVLSNGSVVYDLSGNVWEHVNKANTISGAGYNDGQTSVAGSSNGTDWDDDGIYDTGDMDKYASLYHLGKNNGMGNLYYADGRIDNVFLRGASANDGSGAGGFTLYLDRTSGAQSRLVGFRCAK